MVYNCAGTAVLTIDSSGNGTILGSKNVTNFLCNEVESILGAKFAFESDPIKAAHLMIEHIDKKRKALKLKPLMYQ